MYFCPACFASRAQSRAAFGFGLKCFASSSYCGIGMPSTSIAHSCRPMTLYSPQWMNIPNLASCHHCMRRSWSGICCEQGTRLCCDRFCLPYFCIRNAWYSTRPMHSDLNQNAAVARGLLKENVAQRLREEILAARISPGEKIVEGKWAREYGVAQISVREALNILATQGFVTKGHGRSARVLKLQKADIIHIYQVRGALEALAARLITE